MSGLPVQRKGGNERRIAETKRASYSCVPPLPTFFMASRPDILCGRIAPATRGDKSGVRVVWQTFPSRRAHTR